MRGLTTNILSDKITSRAFLISILLIALTIFFVLINYKNLPPFLPVFNQLPWGTARLTQTAGIFIPVSVFSIIFIFNLILSAFVYLRNPLVARMIAAITLIIAVINFLFTVRTIFLLI